MSGHEPETSWGAPLRPAYGPDDVPAERLGATTNNKDVVFCVREVERLACFVHAVNTYCSAVPRGAVEQRERAVINPVSKIPSAAATGGSIA